MDCPKCGYSQVDCGDSCARCGLIFARYRPCETARALPGRPVIPSDEPPVAPAWALWTGTALGALFVAVPFLRFFGSVLSTLVHEFGHAAVAWAFGYPSIPAFDLVYGGGVTIHDARNPGLLIAAGGAFLFACWSFRRSARVLAGLGAGALAYLLLALTSGHEALIIAAGHASELVLAGLFIYRGVTGAACRIEAERPLYAGAGTFIALHAAYFGWQLVTDATFRALYDEAKGGGGWMDLSRLSAEFSWGSVAGLGGWLALLGLLTPPLALLAARGVRRGP